MYRASSSMCACYGALLGKSKNNGVAERRCLDEKSYVDRETSSTDTVECYLEKVKTMVLLTGVVLMGKAMLRQEKDAF